MVECLKFSKADNASSVSFEISGVLPEFDSLEDLGRHYDSEAERLKDLIVNSLPQGVRIRFVSKLLDMKLRMDFLGGR